MSEDDGTRDPDRRSRLYDRPSYRSLIARVAHHCRRLRGDRGWTQVQTSVRAEMSLYLYQRVESGRCNATFTTLARIADAFAVDVAEFFAPIALAESKKRKHGRKDPTTP